MGMAVVTVISAVAVPYLGAQVRNYRIRSGVNLVASELNVAKMKAMAQATSYQVVPSGTTVALNVENLSTGVFALAANTAAMPLPPGVSFGFGSLTTGAGDSGEQNSATGGTAPAESSAITFNSMGMPVDSSGNPLAQNAIYLTDGVNYGAVTVSLGGRILTWYWQNGAWLQG